MSTTAAPAARKDNLLGICHAIGEDFGFNPIFLRIPLAVGIIFSAKWTLIAYGAMVHTALEATDDLDGASIEVLDLRSLVPLDSDAILDSVRRCSKVVIVDEANQMCAAGAQVAALIAEHAFEHLDGPVVRVATPDVPIPFSPPLEQAVLPGADRVKEACRDLLAY